MKEKMQREKGGLDSQLNPMDAAVQLMVEQAILEDEMIAIYGIDEDELNAAITHYQLMNDPEIVKTLNDNIQKLNTMSRSMKI